MRTLVYGYYGRRNFGDDILMKSCVEQFGVLDQVSKIAVSGPSSAEGYVRKLCPQIDGFEPIESGLGFFKNYDRVIFGGGGTVFDYRANLTRFYQIRKRFSDYRYYGIPRNSGTRFGSVGLGIGPFATNRARTIAMNQLKYHDFIFTRDKTSYDFAVNERLRDNKLAHDICFFEIDNIQQTKSETKQFTNCATFVIREYKYGNQNKNCLDNMIKFAKFLKTEGFQIKWVSFQPGYDDPAIEKVRCLGDTVWEWNPDTMRIEDGYLIMAESSLIITARMHGTYIAGMLGLPCLSLSLHPKLKYAAEYFSNSTCVSPKCFEDILEAGKLLLNEKENSVPSEQIRTINQEMRKMVRSVKDWLA